MGDAVRVAQKKATKAQALEDNEDNKVTAADKIAGSKQAAIEKLQNKLKTTSSESGMVKIFDKINKLKAAEDGVAPAVNKEKAEKIRINDAKLRAQQAGVNAKERAEKSSAKQRKKVEAREEQAAKSNNDALAKTNELARKTIDKVRAEERKKTLAAEKQADNLKSTLLKFMQHAHDKLFSADAKSEFAADKAAKKAKAQADNASEEYKKAKLAKKLADDKEAAAANNLKGIMKEISMGSADPAKLTSLSQKAQASKSNVVAARAAAAAAAQTLAEKAQTLSIIKAKAAEKEKTAEKKDAKVAKEAKAENKVAKGQSSFFW